MLVTVPVGVMDATSSSSCEWSKRESLNFFCFSDADWHRKRELFVQNLRQAAVDEHPVPYIFWQNNWEPQFSCSFEKRVGDPGDGGKWLCDPYKLQARSDASCLLYSFGSANDFTWEEAMHELLPSCDIHTFDHTLRQGTAHPPPYVTYHYWGIAASNRAPLFTISTIQEKLGHSGRMIEALKIDVEGSEYEVLLPLIEGGGLSFVRQLLIELHYERIPSHYPPRGPFLNRRPRRNAVVHPPRAHHRFFWAMAKAGFVIFHKEPNTAYSMGACVEYSFVKLSWSTRELFNEARSRWCIGGWFNRDDTFKPTCQAWGALPPGANMTLLHLGYVSNENRGKPGKPRIIQLERDDDHDWFRISSVQRNLTIDTTKPPAPQIAAFSTETGAEDDATTDTSDASDVVPTTDGTAIDTADAVQVEPMADNTIMGSLDSLASPATMEAAPTHFPTNSSASREKSKQRTRSLLLLIPTHVGHLEATLQLIGSILNSMADAELASIRLVVSGANEHLHFEQPISWILSKHPAAAKYDIAIEDLDRILRYFGIVPPRDFWRFGQKSITCPAGYSGPRAICSVKFLFQFVKKLYSARYFQGFHSLLLLDADTAFVTSSFSVLELFKAGGMVSSGSPAPPSVILMRMDHDKLMYRPCLDMLGESRSPFLGSDGQELRPWGLQTWFWRRDIVLQLFEFVEIHQNKSLLQVAMSVFRKGERCFESSLYWAFAKQHKLSNFTQITLEETREILPFHKSHKLRDEISDDLEFFGSLVLERMSCSDSATLRRFMSEKRILFLRFADAKPSPSFPSMLRLPRPDPTKSNSQCPCASKLECVLLNHTIAVAHFDIHFWSQLSVRCKTRDCSA